MYQQIPLIPDKNHQATTPGSRLGPPPAQQIRGTIQRSLNELQATRQDEPLKYTMHSLPYLSQLWYFKNIAGNGPAQKQNKKMEQLRIVAPFSTVKLTGNRDTALEKTLYYSNVHLVLFTAL